MSQENLTPEEMLLKIYKSTEKTRRYILWIKIFSFIKLLFIIIAILLLIIYLPPYINKLMTDYQSLLNSVDGLQNMQNNMSGGDINSLLDQLKGGGLNFGDLLKGK